MTDLYFPAHKLCYVHGEHQDILLAATGSCIQSLSGNDRKLLSLWPRDDNDAPSDEDSGQDERPAKRQRIDSSSKPGLGREGSELSEASIEIISEGKERQKGERRRPKIPDLTLPHVSHLVATSDGKHVVAMTVEDKAVRVFSVSPKGRLRQLHSRCMPKKSCALKLLPDQKTILTADKFGDVYAIPLHPSGNYQSKSKNETLQPTNVFEPSASALTVHTKGNLDALRQQQRQKQKQPRKEGPDFEHKLLLGHVSLLTDLAIAEGPVNGKLRPFILTADRDEHIRVSRGIPQTHIIHNFCSGHTEFVSKLCIVPWAPHVLVAGNGEPSLRVYDWQQGQQMTRYDIWQYHKRDIEDYLADDRILEKLVISGIWTADMQGEDLIASGSVLLVALEGLPLLFIFKLRDFELSHTQTIKLDGNVLDFVQFGSSNQLIVSLDGIHKNGSCKDYRSEVLAPENTLQVLSINNAKSGSIGSRPTNIQIQHAVDATKFGLKSFPTSPLIEKNEKTGYEANGENSEKPFSIVGEFLYGLENLRKRRGKAGEDDEIEDAADGMEDLEVVPNAM